MCDETNKNMAFHRLNNISDVLNVLDDLINGNSVVVNIENLSNSDAQRAVDMLSGAAYCNSWTVCRADRFVYMVDIDLQRQD